MTVSSIDPQARRTLRIVAIFWLTFFLIIFGVGFSLSRKAQATQALVGPHLAQPKWSESEEHVAYLSQPAEGGAWELWRVQHLNHTAQLLCKLDPGEWTLLGWMNGDKQLLLQPKDQSTPRVLTVDANNGHQQEIRFEANDGRLINVREGQMLFQRNGPAQERGGSVTVLKWAPGEKGYTPVVTIPYESEKLQVEGAWPSPDNHWLAMVIRMGETEERTLWLYDLQKDALRWTGIRVPCLAIRGAWAPDSEGLVAAAETNHGCDLYAFWQINRDSYTPLSSGQEHHAYQPFWPRSQEYFLLLEGNDVLQFDPKSLQATPLEAKGWERHGSRDLAVSPRGSLAVYVARQEGDDQLFQVDFQGHSTAALLAESSKITVRKELWYVLGDSFHTFLQTFGLSR